MHISLSMAVCRGASWQLISEKKTRRQLSQWLICESSHLPILVYTAPVELETFFGCQEPTAIEMSVLFIYVFIYFQAKTTHYLSNKCATVGSILQAVISIFQRWLWWLVLLDTLDSIVWILVITLVCLTLTGMSCRGAGVHVFTSLHIHTCWKTKLYQKK